MKPILKSILITLLISGSLRISAQDIKLMSLIDSAIANKGTIRAVRTDIVIARLQTSAAYKKYLPDLAFSYNYRYNAIIPTQIIPVGQFNPVPTDEKRPIKFGTEWQQNSGLNLFQPIIDFSIKNRVAESRINEKLKNNDAFAAERDLKMEVVKSFTNIWLMEEQLNSAILDTVRTARTKDLFIIKSEEGKVLKTEFNKAFLNHNNALSDYSSYLSSLTREKIYLSFLTGISPETLLKGKFDFSPLSVVLVSIENENTVPDSVPSITSLRLKAELLNQQQRSEKVKNTPVIGFDGFLGANQYADKFNPILSGSWFGSSYLGLSLRFQILSGSSTRTRVGQLKLEEKAIRYRLDDEMKNIRNKTLIMSENIKQLKYQLGLLKDNLALSEENLSLYQERFDKGQMNAYELLNEEIDFQKEKTRFNEKKAELVFRQIELINNTGSLSGFLADLH